METDPEQIFYIQYDNKDGYVTGQITQQRYNQLTDDQKKNYRQVIVDQSHLYGWGRWWNTVRYVNGSLHFPNNWQPDQSQQINSLQSELKEMQQELKQLMSAQSK